MPPDISLICIRDLGNNAAEDIVDVLFTETSIMAERARVFFNENESNRIQSSNLCPLKPFILPTSLVRINNFDEGIHTAMMISTDITIKISDNDVTMDSNINVERLLP